MKLTNEPFFLLLHIMYKWLCVNQLCLLSPVDPVCDTLDWTKRRKMYNSIVLLFVFFFKFNIAFDFNNIFLLY